MHIRDPVSDHQRLPDIIGFTIQIGKQHTDAGFAGWRLIPREGPVNMNGAEIDPFVFQGLDYKLMDWPEMFFRK